MKTGRLYVNWVVFMTWILLLLCNLGSAGAVPPNWIHSDDGLPAVSALSTNVYPKFFLFSNHVYLFPTDAPDLYVQLYNEPCFGWQKRIIPSGTAVMKPVGDYLFAVGGGCYDLWWIDKDVPFSQEAWNKVTISGSDLPSCISSITTPYLIPLTSFNGQIYARLAYLPNCPSGPCYYTFDIYRSADIGQTNMTWEKVVSEGFGDPQNHVLGYMGVFKNKLIAITGNTYNGLFGDTSQYLRGIQVWESQTGDWGTWKQVNEDGFGTKVGNVGANCEFGAATEYYGYFYVGTQSQFGAEIWRYDGSGMTTGWTNVTPPTLGMPTPQGAGRVMDMAVFNDLLYVAEGYPTANLDSYDGTTWTVVEKGPSPFDPVNTEILQLAVLPSRFFGTPENLGSTGDKLFLLAGNGDNGQCQVWSYPFPYAPLTCSVLDQATVSISPTTATNELGPGQTHTVIATVNAGSGAYFSDLQIPFLIEVGHLYTVEGTIGWVGSNGLFGWTYNAVQGPDGLYTDTITACISNSQTRVCCQATKTWQDTIPPDVTIITPANGAKYLLNQVVPAQYTIYDAVGVLSTSATVPVGKPIPTSRLGSQTFTVTATDYGKNTNTKSVTYTVETPAQGTQDLKSAVSNSPIPQEIKDGLNDKLNAAINALNQGNKKAAINILQAFINMINAQRGKSITNAQADSWIAEAQNIINSIKAS